MAEARNRNKLLGEKEEEEFETPILGNDTSAVGQFSEEMATPLDVALTGTAAGAVAKKVPGLSQLGQIPGNIASTNIAPAAAKGTDAVSKALRMGSQVGKVGLKGAGIPLFAYSALDSGVRGATGTGISERIGEDVIAPVASGVQKLVTGDRMNQGAMTDAEQDLISKGLNPQKPIKNKRGSIIGYEKVSPTEDLPTSPNLSSAAGASPSVADQSSALDNLRNSLNNIQGVVGGGEVPLQSVSAEGTMQPISEQDAQAFQAMQRLQGTPTYSGVQEEGMVPVVDPTGQRSFMTPEDKALAEERMLQQKIAQQQRMVGMLQDPAYQDFRDQQRAEQAAGRATFEQASMLKDANIDAAKAAREAAEASPSASDPFTSAQLRDAFGGGDSLKAAKAQMRAGINPFTNKSFEVEALQEAQLRSNLAEAPTQNKYEQAESYLRKVASDYNITDPEEIQKFVMDNMSGVMRNEGIIPPGEDDPLKKLSPENKSRVEKYAQDRGIPVKEAMDELINEGELTAELSQAGQ